MVSVLPSEGLDEIMSRIASVKESGSRELDISDLKIKYMPMEVSNLQKVTILKAVNCSLEAVNYWPPNLVKIDLCNNFLDESSINIEKMPMSTRIIDISYNQFGEFKDWPDFLVSINLSGHDNLTPSNVDAADDPTVVLPTNCEELIMTDCNLDDETIKYGVIKFNYALTTLNLSDNMFENVLLYIPQDCVDNLKELYLDDNRISYVDLSHWSNLETVSLKNNMLDENSLFASSILVADLDRNQFASIPLTLVGAVDISIADNNIEEILDFPSDDLKKLDVSKNDIKKFPIDANKLDQFICDNTVHESDDDDAVSIGSSSDSLLNLLNIPNDADDDFNLYGNDSSSGWSTQANSAQSNTWDRWRQQNNRFTVTTHHSPPKYAYHNRSNDREIKHTKLIIV
jgi:hypothetical protein